MMKYALRWGFGILVFDFLCEFVNYLLFVLLLLYLKIEAVNQISVKNQYRASSLCLVLVNV